jgi:replicative DNA helicase
VKDYLLREQLVDRRSDAGPIAPSCPAPSSATEVLWDLDQVVRRGEASALAPLPAGFLPLDRYLDGGLRSGDLILVGGAPGVGKTTLTLQMARNLVAQSTASCAYVCYEHPATFLLQRLLTLEAFLAMGNRGADALTLGELRQLLVVIGRQPSEQSDRGIGEVLGGQIGAAAALAKLQTYGDRLCLTKASGYDTDVNALRRIIRALKEKHGPRVVVFVDYLQKIPVFPAVADENDRTTQVVNDLKDLALAEEVPIVAVVAADREGLSAQRLRMHHFRGSSALAYEADVTLILNNKYRIVAKKSIAFNSHQAQEFRQWVVCTLEKNRSGLDAIDLEFRAHFAHAAFDPTGRLVVETLIDDRVEER